MKIVIRADASTQIGTGHVMRCRTLARELRRRGSEVVFVCRSHDGNLIGTLCSEGFDVRPLPVSDMTLAGGLTETHSDWLGTTEDVDASETLAAMGDAADWVVIDHYALSAKWHSEVRQRAGQLMAIDDLADRPLDCDLLLDQNLSEVDASTRYRSLVSDHCRGLFGPRFALLSPAYAERRRTLRVRDGNVRRMLVAMGGSDLADATGLVADAMSAPDLRHIELDIVVGANYPFRERLRERLAGRGKAQIRGPLPDLVEAMAQADLAIGAGGSTSWERLCLGLPTLVISIAENQVGGCRALDRAGVAIYAGPVDLLELEAFLPVLVKTLDDPVRLRDMSERGKSMVDGLGTSRIADSLMGLS